MRRTPSRPGRAGGLLLPLLLLGGSGCASWDLRAARRSYYAGRYAEAIERLTPRAEEENRHQVLFLMERGMAYREAGLWEEACRDWDAAAKRIDALEVRSVSGEVGRFLWNDTTVPYRGEPQERVLIHTEGMVTRLAAGDREGAAVEARRAVRLLKDVDDEEAFPLTRYLAGLAYEGVGARDDARIEFRAAMGEAPDWDPPRLDLERIESGRAATDRGIVVLVAELGRGPVKVEEILPIPPSFKFVVPAYEERGGRSNRAVLVVDGEAWGRTHDVVDVAERARDALERRVLVEVAKETGRAVVAEVIAHNIEVDHGEWAGLGFRILYYIAHTTDLRCWQTLPDRIAVLRVEVPSGEDLPTEFHILDEGGNLLRVVPGPAVTLRPGELRVLHVRATE